MHDETLTDDTLTHDALTHDALTGRHADARRAVRTGSELKTSGEDGL